MQSDCLKLTTYFGERDRVANRFLADALIDIYARHELRTSVLLRGVEGFGIRHRLQTARLLTLSEDLPLVTAAVDERARIEAVLCEVQAVFGHGLLTLERARMLTGRLDAVELAEDRRDATKLTIYVGRQERCGALPAWEAVVGLLHSRGIAGATALLGVDGTAHGVRERARFFARNAAVPMMIISVGDADRIAGVLSELGGLLARPLVTLERVRVCKRDGVRLSDPGDVPTADSSGLGVWQKLMVYSGEQARFDGQPLYAALVRRLRAEGAAGATVLRAFWGYHGDHAPHGERFWSLRRHAPLLTVIVDSPERTRRWFELVDEMTGQAGLVTSEIVPALRGTGPGIEHGGLALSQRRP